MGVLWVGPWHLDPCRMGRKFDVKKFIMDAEAGMYDGEEPFCLNRKAPWYQQLKLDVESGVYDDGRMKDEKAVFRQWLDEKLQLNPCFSDRPVDRWYRIFLMSNAWTTMAMVVAGSVPGPLGLNVHSVISSFMRHPKSGWRVK